MTTASVTDPTPDEMADQAIAVAVGETGNLSDESAVATSAKADVTQTARLAQLAKSVRQHHTGMIGSARQTLEHARDAGLALSEARKLMPHRAWETWVEKNCDVSLRTAQKYMQIANNWSKLQTKAPLTAPLTIDAATKLLKKPTGGSGDKAKNTQDRHTIARDGRKAADLDGDHSFANDDEDNREDRRDEGLHPDREELGEADHEEPGDDGVQSASRKNSLSESAAGYLLANFGNGEPRPAPVPEEITPTRAIRAWIYETTLPKEQAHRSQQMVHGSVSRDDVVRVGRQVIMASFWAMVWARLIEEVGNDENAMFRLTETNLPAPEAAGLST